MLRRQAKAQKGHCAHQAHDKQDAKARLYHIAISTGLADTADCHRSHHRHQQVGADVGVDAADTHGDKHGRNSCKDAGKQINQNINAGDIDPRVRGAFRIAAGQDHLPAEGGFSKHKRHNDKQEHRDDCSHGDNRFADTDAGQCGKAGKLAGTA